MTNPESTYLSDFAQVLLFGVGGILFVSLALLTSWILGPRRPNPEKLSSYESGEEPVGTAWVQFNVRFYVIALVFLLFEVELIFLFPWAIVFASEELQAATSGLWGWMVFWEMILFILVLAAGLAYAWVHGHLDWVKPDPKPTSFKSPVPGSMYEQLNKKYV
jgi:NADH-quinone oxidoreductase subunit A